MNERALELTDQIIARIETLQRTADFDFDNPSSMVEDLYFTFQGVGNTKPVVEQVFEFNELIEQLKPDHPQYAEILKQQYDNILTTAKSVEQASIDQLTQALTAMLDHLKGQWTLPMRKKEICGALNLTYAQLRSWQKTFVIEQIGISKLYQVRLDLLDPRTRNRFEQCD